MSFQLCFGDQQGRLAELTELGDPLVRLSALIDFEFFRPMLDEVFLNPQRTHKCGRPRWDSVVMFKIMILQELNNLADSQTQFMINDRLSYKRFLGLDLSSPVPDAKTIWAYKNMLAMSGKSKALFDMFTAALVEKGIVTKRGSIVDASFVDVPRQRNTRAENNAIKNNETPEEWLGDDPKSRHKLAQKDIDARWAKKGDETHYGYKDHVKVDQDSKLIVEFAVSEASQHDSQVIVQLLDDTDRVVYADSAYVGLELHQEIKETYPNVSLRIHEKAYRNKPLSDQQKASNTEKSRIRARVEHVFGYMETSMGGPFVRCIGIVRATMSIALKNLAYNFARYAYLAKRGLAPVLTWHHGTCC